MCGKATYCEKNITVKLLERHFPDVEIVKIGTFVNKLSFNVVLRKPGIFTLGSQATSVRSGYDIDKGRHLRIPYYYHCDMFHDLSGKGGEGNKGGEREEEKPHRKEREE